MRLRTEAKSSRKGVEFVDVAIDGPIQPAGLAAGHTPGTLRIAHDLKYDLTCSAPQRAHERLL